MSLRFHCCEPGWEAVLRDELGRVFPAGEHRQAALGWLASQLSDKDAAREGCLAFADQSLLSAVPLEAGSVSQWAAIASERLIDGLRTHDGPWRLHVFRVASETSPSRGRCQLIESAIRDILKRKQRRLLRTLNAEPEGPWLPDEALVQIGLFTAGEGAISVCSADQRLRLRRCLSPFVGGMVEVPPDRQAPARAFAKLAEVELRLHRQIQAGETCVDLGASPGSWTYVVVQRGAHVTAIDRSELRSDLMQHPRVTFERADAFRYRPPAPVDWLLCDVIAFPQRSLDLLREWLAARLCRRFCVTIKFRGGEDYALLEPAKEWLTELAPDHQLRRLTNNKNEVTAFGHAAE